MIYRTAYSLNLSSVHLLAESTLVHELPEAAGLQHGELALASFQSLLLPLYEVLQSLYKGVAKKV